ncbi:MAG TPA: WYL domain-containing protein, partial [Allocoleopsis sp.]
ISGEWRGKLDSIKVYLHFQGWLAKAYEPKDDDIENELIGDVRQVVRRVVNPFWLIREVSRYWEDCLIISPDSLRDRLKQKLRTLCDFYDIETTS